MTAATIAPSGPLGAGRHKDAVQDRLLGGNLGDLGAVSDNAECLVPLLRALGWRGTARHIAQAMPHFVTAFTLQDLRQTLAALHLRTRSARTNLGDIDDSQFPCLFLPDGGTLSVVLGRRDSRYQIHDGRLRSETEIANDALQGTAYLVSHVDLADAAPAHQSWFATLARRFRGIVLQMATIALFNSLFAIAVPLFIMAVYDQVVGTRSLEALSYLTAGIGLALTIDIGLRVVRARLQAYVAGRLDMSLGTSTFERILRQPLSRTGNASLGAQLTHLRQFEAVRDFFTGPLAGAFLELPFTLVYIAVIAVLGGWLAAIPLVLLVVFLLLGIALNPSVRRSAVAASETRLERQSFLIEMLENLRTIKLIGAEDVWRERHRDISARSTIKGHRAAQVSGLVSALAQSMMFSAGIAAISFGALRALSGDISVGALIAIMALIWRVLSPIYMTYLSLASLNRVIVAIRQIDRLMKLPYEREGDPITELMRKFDGRVDLIRTSFRYSQRTDPALIGVSLTAKPGQLIAIVGPSGSGKSTLIKLIAALHTPQAGNILIDGIDLRQLNPGEARRNAALLSQEDRLFYGTISQNLRLANPTATDLEIYAAIADAGLEQDIAKLPEGLETRLTDSVQHHLAKSFVQRLLLARVYVTDAPILLLDEPGRNLDLDGDRVLMATLERLRGNKTVFVVTHRPSHMRLADTVVHLESGTIAQIGTPDEVLPKLLGEKTQ